MPILIIIAFLFILEFVLFGAMPAIGGDLLGAFNAVVSVVIGGPFILCVMAIFITRGIPFIIETIQLVIELIGDLFRWLDKYIKL